MLEHIGLFNWGDAVMTTQSFAWRKKNGDAKKKWWATHLVNRLGILVLQKKEIFKQEVKYDYY